MLYIYITFELADVGLQQVMMRGAVLRVNLPYVIVVIMLLPACNCYALPTT